MNKVRSLDNVLPSADFDFRYSKYLDPRVTFTRASGANWVAPANGTGTVGGSVYTFNLNVPRLTDDGLLVEEQRTNILLNSNTAATQSVTTNAADYTLSFEGTGTVVLSGTATGTLVGTGANDRVSLTVTATAGTCTATVTGTVTNAQFEEGAFPTSYIPTTTAEVTRAVDLITITGGVDQWFNADEGAWVFDVDVFGSSDDYPRLLQSNQSHLWEYQTFNSAPTQAALLFSGWLTGQTTKTPYGIAPTGEFKIAANYSIGNKSPIYIDSTEQVRGDSTYTPGTGPVTFPTEFRIFRQSNGGQFLNGYVKSLRYYSTGISDYALQGNTYIKGLRKL